MWSVLPEAEGFSVVVIATLSVLFVFIPLPPIAHFQFIVTIFNLVVPIIIIIIIVRNTIMTTSLSNVSFPMV